MKRSLIAQIRLGILPLEVEVGRYSKLEKDEQICKLCKKCTETELHFLFDCETLDTVRTDVMNKCPEINGMSGIEKFSYLSNMPYRFGNIVKELWLERERVYNIPLI